MLDTPFPGEPAKFDLINGWRVARSTGTTRTAYRRARLFRSRGAAAVLRFEARSTVPARITLLVNAVPAGTTEVGAAWTALEADIAAVPPGEPFVLEFQREGEPADFDAGCFEVRLPGTRAPPGPALGARLRDLLPRRLLRLAGLR
jgi:hypothetical protein